MKNCLILGAGRSGTSMAAGSLAKAGYFMGENLIAARKSNPKGFFEDVEVNMINEELLGYVVPARKHLLGIEFFPSRPVEGQRWLSCVPVETAISCPRHISERIRMMTSREPFCFKDPRFSYTLSAWRPFLRNTVFVCVFRDPASTALSMIKECKEASYLKSLKMSFTRALNVWRMMYARILRVHSADGEWLFLHYDQFIKGTALERLKTSLGAGVDYTFPDVSLNRCFSNKPVPTKNREVYRQLCKLAGFQ